jgi:hypothetical protein
MFLKSYRLLKKYIENSNNDYSISKTLNLDVLGIKNLIKNNIISKTEHYYYGKSFSQRELVNNEKIQKSENQVNEKFSDVDYEDDHKLYFNNTKIMRLKNDFDWDDTSINFIYFGFKKPFKFSIDITENELGSIILFKKENSYQSIFSLFYFLLIYCFFILLLFSLGSFLYNIFYTDDVIRYLKFVVKIFPLIYFSSLSLIILFAIIQTEIKKLFYKKKMNVIIDRFNLIVFRDLHHTIKII